MGLPDAAKFGPPDLHLGAFQLWVHNQPYAGTDEPYDADWLSVTAHCGASGASVWATGAILTSSSIDRFRTACDQMRALLNGKASLASDEPNLSVYLTATDGYGHVAMVVDITPDHMRQEHHFEFELDQTYLFDVARQCDTILARYPNPHAV